MELNAQAELFGVYGFNGFDDAVGLIPAAGYKAFRDLIHCLVVQGVGDQAGIADDLGEFTLGSDLHGMPFIVAVAGLAVLHGTGSEVGNIGDHGAAASDVDHLMATADTQNGDTHCSCLAQELHFGFVTGGVRILRPCHSFFVQVGCVNIIAACQQQTIDLIQEMGNIQLVLTNTGNQQGGCAHAQNSVHVSNGNDIFRRALDVAIVGGSLVINRDTDP